MSQPAVATPPQPSSQPNAPQRPAPRRSHLRAGALALAALIALAAIAYQALGAWEARYLDALAPAGEDEAVRGLSLTRMALAQRDRLVLFGSSELTFQDQYHPARLFAGRPTGFATYVVGSGYRQSIHNVLALSALGDEVRGRRIVLFVSPTWFTKTIGQRAYQKNFSLLQAYSFVYTSPLPAATKQTVARRLLHLGPPATDDPLLHNALEALARGDAYGRVKYWASWPFGRLALLQLEFKDRWDVARLILRKRIKPAPQPSTAATAGLDWDALRTRAGQEAAAQTAGNRFGMEDAFYAKYVAPKLDELADQSRNDTLLDSSEYEDLQLSLTTLKDLGARPLFISLPVMGSYYDFKGHPVSDRRAYYARVRRQIEQAGFPVVDLSDKEYEPGFNRDPWHQGWKGAVEIAQTLDRFYHGSLPDAGR